MATYKETKGTSINSHFVIPANTQRAQEPESSQIKQLDTGSSPV